MMSHFETKLLLILFSSLLFACSSLQAEDEDKDCNCRKDPVVQLAALSRDVAQSTNLFDGVRHFSELAHDQEVKSLWPGVDGQSLSGVQKIFCHNNKTNYTTSATANFVCNGSTIVTNSHAIVDVNAKLKWEDKDTDCFVVVNTPDGNNYRYEIKKKSLKELEEGNQIGTRYFKSPTEKSKDWVVLEIEPPVDPQFARPFKVASFSSSLGLVGSPIVSAGANYHRLERGGYEVCQYTSTASDGRMGTLETNCHTDKGASGGPQLIIQNDQPLLTSITQDSITPGSSKNSSTVPVKGGFQEAISKFSGDPSCSVPLDAPVSSAQGS